LPSNRTSASPSPLLHNLIVFGRLLRHAGIRVTSGQIAELAHSLTAFDLTAKEDVRQTARSILVSRHDDLALFDRAFDLFWGRREGIRDVQLEEFSAAEAPSGAPIARAQGGGDGAGEARLSLAEPTDGGAPAEDTILAMYSSVELLRRRDFARMNEEELTDARRFLAQMRWTVTRRRSQRLRPSRHGRRLDVRRSFRHSIRSGGEMLELARLGPKPKRRPLVVLCDISGSMDRYSRLLLHFLHSIQSSRERTEVFLFGTRLTRITPQLRRRDPDAAISAVAADVQDFSGGTRIGESLRTFNRRWARRVLGQGAIVLIISDGWDRGDPEVLAAEMARLQRSSHRLMWLNPLLGSPRYEPLTQGIRAALPYVDDFLPAHNLASLEALAAILNEVQEGRPDRQQHPATP